MVDPPSTTRPCSRSRAAARATASQSTPRWRQNRASSVSTTATRIHRLTFSSGTAVRSSGPCSAASRRPPASSTSDVCATRSAGTSSSGRTDTHPARARQTAATAATTRAQPSRPRARRARRGRPISRFRGPRTGRVAQRRTGGRRSSTAPGSAVAGVVAAWHMARRTSASAGAGFIPARASVRGEADLSCWRVAAVSTPSAPLEEQLQVLTSGVAELHPRDALAERLGEGRPLRVKLGIDPSSAHLTLGHAVVLRKLAQFQRFGHTVVLIIGNFTGLVGDPSGRSQTRRLQTEAEVAEHARTYLEQVARVLDVDAAEVRWNAEWLAQMTFADVARLAAHVTVANLLERDDFRKRYAAGQPISLVEFLYPLMQGMDSVAIRADLELGGTDQTFNLHVGRDLQRAHGQPGQVVLTMPLLRGTDGVQKMSKSLDNGIYLDEPPEAQFGKLMRIPDEVLGEYLRLTTDLDPAEADRLADKAAAGGAAARDVKRRLAREVVTLYHGPEAAADAEAAFDAGVRARAGAQAEAGVARGTGEALDARVETVPTLAIPRLAVRDGQVWVVALLADAGLVRSRSE